MALVPAWDTRTGQKLPNDVPKHWIKSKTFPHLVGTAAAATKAQDEAPAPADAEAQVVAEQAATTTRKGR